jgi:hypothetical protein
MNNAIKNKIVKYIINELFPVFRGEETKLIKQAEVTQDDLNSILGKIDSDPIKRRAGCKNAEDKLLIIKNHVFELWPSKSFSDSILYMNHANYEATYLCNKSQLKENYVKGIESELEEQCKITVSADIGTQNKLPKISEDEFYDEEYRIGYRKVNENLYLVIRKLGEYIVDDKITNTGKYKFPGCTLAIPIKNNNGNIIRGGDGINPGGCAVVLEPYLHPATTNNGESIAPPGRPFCLGRTYSNIVSARDSDGKPLTMAQQIALIMHDAEATLKHGYIKGSIPHTPITDHKFRQYKIA